MGDLLHAPNGTIEALYVNYACHVDNVGGTQISADFPRYLVARLPERLDNQPFVLFTKKYLPVT